TRLGTVLLPAAEGALRGSLTPTAPASSPSATFHATVRSFLNTYRNRLRRNLIGASGGASEATGASARHPRLPRARAPPRSPPLPRMQFGGWWPSSAPSLSQSTDFATLPWA